MPMDMKSHRIPSRKYFCRRAFREIGDFFCLGDTLGLKFGKKCNFWILAKLKMVKIGISFGAKFNFGQFLYAALLKE